MDKTIILHCGAPKTGSTTFQHLMYGNRELLLQAGIFCPATSRKRTKGRDMRVAMAQLSSKKGKSLAKGIKWARKRVEEVFRDPSIHTFVLSNEGFLGKPFFPGRSLILPNCNKQVDALAAVLEGYKIEVRFFVRDLSTFLPSWYVQQVRMGSTQSFEDFIANLDPAQLSWMPAVHRLREQFGADAVKVFSLAELAADTHGCLSRAFPEVMAALGDKGHEVPRKNKTVGSGMVNVYRNWNRLSQRLFGKGNFGKRMHQFGRRYMLLPFERFSNSPKLVLPPALARDLSDRFKLEWAEIVALQSSAPSDASRTS